MIDSWLPELLNDLYYMDFSYGLTHAIEKRDKASEALTYVVHGVYEIGEARESIRTTLFGEPKSSPIHADAELSDLITEVAKDLRENGQDLFVAMMDRKGEFKGNGWAKIVPFKCNHRNGTYYSVQRHEPDKPCEFCGTDCGPVLVTPSCV